MPRYSTLQKARTPNNQYTDERYRLLGLNMVMPDQLIVNGESPYTINTRMYAREDGQSRVAIRTRKGPGFYSVPVGEAVDKQQTSVTGATDNNFNQSRRLAQPMSPTATGLLSAVDLNLKQSNGIGTVIVEIRTDNAGSPGDLLAISGSTGNSLVSTYGYVKFRFISAPNLTVGTTYWIVIYAQDDNTNFYQASTTTNTTTGKVSVNSGGSYTPLNASLNFKTYTCATGAIKGWYRAYFSNGTKATYFAHGTSLYVVNDTTGIPSVIKTGLSSSATRYRFDKINDKVIVVNGFDQPQTIVSGNTVAVLPGVPFIPDKVVVWKNRVFFTQLSDKSRVFFSELADETTYPSTNFFYAPAPKTSDPITALLIFQDNLIIFTSETKYIYYGDGSISGSRLRQAIGTKGALAQEGVTNDRNLCYFVADDQVYAFNGATDALISDKVQPEVDGFASRPGVSVTLYNNQLRIYYAKAGQAQNNGMLLLDNIYAQWFMDTDAYCDLPGQFSQDVGNPLVETSSIYGAMFYAEQNFNNLGAPLDFKYWTPYNKYISAMSKDRVHKFHPELRPAAITYTMQIGKDTNFLNAPNMVPYVVNSGGYIWGADTSIWGGLATWGGGEYQDTAVALTGRGNHSQYRLERYGANTPVEIYGYAALIKSSRLK